MHPLGLESCSENGPVLPRKHYLQHGTHDQRPPVDETADGSSSQVVNVYSLDNQGLWITDIRLLGLELCVRVLGKPVTIIMQLNADNTAVEVCMKKGKKKVRMSPFMVQAMEPSTPRNYECWVVIKGNDTGKHVRSIHYTKGITPKMPIWWTVAVVLPSAREEDILTGEELHLESTCLCLEDESADSKHHNMQFSWGLREEAPKSVSQSTRGAPAQGPNQERLGP